MRLTCRVKLRATCCKQLLTIAKLAFGPSKSSEIPKQRYFLNIVETEISPLKDTTSQHHEKGQWGRLETHPKGGISSGDSQHKGTGGDGSRRR